MEADEKSIQDSVGLAHPASADKELARGAAPVIFMRGIRTQAVQHILTSSLSWECGLRG